ncbi:unnamed protein product [Arctia plantaginis]|uniref:Poly(A) RNA polymerase, mitochondrial n=1 Tax=Arctia plantaginis TaxID=874455 RepID=A0A8S0YVT2_ARCPL|nr:unnamed protein product [Arctia plantaginis]
MSIFQTIIKTGKRQFYKNLLKSSHVSCKCFNARKSSDVSRKFISFDEVVAQRRTEARQSIVVQVNSEASFNELYGYCSKYATIKGIYHYKNSSQEHFMLIEFDSEDNMKEVLRSCSAHHKDLDVMALKSPFLWFRAAIGRKETFSPPTATLLSLNSSSLVDEDVMLQDMVKCSTVSEQMQLLYDRTFLNDFGTRLRYIVARQLECVLQSLYANIAVRPFGSSVNGFGRMGCDLDLVLTNVVTEDMLDASRRLVYQDKKCEGGRSPWQRHIESVGELLELRVPGATRLQRILHARVPILKFSHEYTDLECDLCYNNMSGVYMSELLWQFGALDPRVRPLTFAVRRWAKTVGLTNPHPGRWITNFSLTLMVLFFLQQKSAEGCVLPPLKDLVKRAGKEDVRITDESLNCTFLRDLNKLPVECYSQKKASLESLLLQFFEFYSQFEFQDKAISINEGTAVRKPNGLPLYIVNPLEQALNVSRNVSFEECERLKLEVRNAAWQLEGFEGQKEDDWGLISLIEKKSTRGLKKLLRVGNSHRLISVKDLFDDTEEVMSENNLRSKLQRLTPKSDSQVDKSVKEMKNMLSNVKDRKENKMKLKNSQVASQVHRIQREKIV